MDKGKQSIVHLKFLEMGEDTRHRILSYVYDIHRGNKKSLPDRKNSEDTEPISQEMPEEFGEESEVEADSNP